MDAHRSSAFVVWRNTESRKGCQESATGKINRGYCTICERNVFFAKAGPWLRDEYLCLRCRSIPRQDLEALTFKYSSFDLVITQDVFEHILRPEKAFAEIARTLKPGGAHVFTVPYYRGKKTVIRARATESGEIEHLMRPDYHANPVDAEGIIGCDRMGR